MQLRNVYAYAVAQGANLVFKMVPELLARNLLLPARMGVWQHAIVLRDLVSRFDPGVPTAALRKLGLLKGAGQEEALPQQYQAALWLQVGVRLVMALCIFIYAAFLSDRPEEWPIVVGVGFLVILVGGYELMITAYQALGYFQGLRRRLIVSSFLVAVLASSGLLLGEVMGLLLGTMAGLAIQVVIMHRGLLPVPLWPPPPWGSARRLLSASVAFRLADIPLQLVLMLDVLVVTALFDRADLAIYGTALLIVSQLGQVPTWLGTVGVSHLVQLMGSPDTGPRDIRVFLNKLYLAQACLILPVLLPLGATLGVVAVRLIMPAYADILQILPTCLACLFFFPSVTVFRNVLMVQKDYRRLAVCNLLALALSGSIFLYLAQRPTFGLSDVAAGAWATYVTTFAIYLVAQRGMFTGVGLFRMVTPPLLAAPFAWIGCRMVLEGAPWNGPWVDLASASARGLLCSVPPVLLGAIALREYWRPKLAAVLRR